MVHVPVVQRSTFASDATKGHPGWSSSFMGSTNRISVRSRSSIVRGGSGGSDSIWRYLLSETQIIVNLNVFGTIARISSKFFPVHSNTRYFAYAGTRSVFIPIYSFKSEFVRLQLPPTLEALAVRYRGNCPTPPDAHPMDTLGGSPQSPGPPIPDPSGLRLAGEPSRPLPFESQRASDRPSASKMLLRVSVSGSFLRASCSVSFRVERLVQILEIFPYETSRTECCHVQCRKEATNGRTLHALHGYLPTPSLVGILRVGGVDSRLKCEPPSGYACFDSFVYSMPFEVVQAKFIHRFRGRHGDLGSVGQAQWVRLRAATSGSLSVTKMFMPRPSPSLLCGSSLPIPSSRRKQRTHLRRIHQSRPCTQTRRDPPSSHADTPGSPRTSPGHPR